MRIRSLAIENFRAIERFEISALNDFILIAGPNGCGKSTVLDALRLIKSLYVVEEWKRWFSEFGINVERPGKFASLFRNPNQPAFIRARFELSPEERAFLLERVENIALGVVLNEATNGQASITGDPPLTKRGTTASDLSRHAKRAEQLTVLLRAQLEDRSTFDAAVRITPAPALELEESPVATAAFSCFNPDRIGEIEFHGSRRNYAREAVSTVRLNVGDRSEERRSKLLYDWENKYRNVKSQLSEEFVSAVLRGVSPDEAPLQKSIKELFRTFFPGKEFLGVTLAADNSLTFPVRLNTGEVHDIDELSSGEKEIVYGYLWLRTGTPRRSVILVDEPELHLNPALVQGLPAFYKANLADALDAQVWIVTHSDVILRQGVRAPGMAVYHMARAQGGGAQQAVKIDSQNAVEAAVLDLIGDLAAYRPYAKIVLVEGHKETRFDVDVVRRLFPEYAERANFIPVGSRRMTSGIRVRLLEVLEETGLAGRAVSISDGDLGLSPDISDSDHFRWPVYEIENFLLDPPVLRAAASVMLRNDPFVTDEEVVETLRRVGRRLIDELAVAEVQYALNGEFLTAVKVGGDHRNPIETLAASGAGSKRRIEAVDISPERIASLLDEARGRLSQFLESSEFLNRFPGDRLMRALAGEINVSADHLRNACLDVAHRLGHRPEGMKRTLIAALA